MMEHAGAALAEAVMRAISRGPVTVLAGGGNNGGAGLCGARHLADRGREVTIVLSSPSSAAGAHHLRILAAMGIRPAEDEPGVGPVVDTPKRTTSSTPGRVWMVSLWFAVVGAHPMGCCAGRAGMVTSGLVPLATSDARVVW